VSRGSAVPEASPQADAHPPIDTSVLDYFREDGAKGASGFLADLIGQFLREAPDRIGKLRKAVNDIDAEAFRLAAHSLKGTSSTIGANEMASICSSLETQSVADTVGEGAVEMLQRLDAEFARVRMALESELRS
jgi:HPt (histidine-containing phosphotransfer) domain-containing protein